MLKFQGVTAASRRHFSPKGTKYTREKMRNRVVAGDCLSEMRDMPTGCVDLIVGSPPYEDVRLYGMKFKLKGDKFVEWCAERFIECCRVSRGPVCWVIEGKTRNGQYSSTPILLHAELVKRGVCMRKPLAYRRYGIPGSGGPDWFRNDWEFVLCGTMNRGRLPWSNNTAMGHPPKRPPGGRPSHRRRDGERVKGKAYKPPKLSNPGNIIDCGAAGGGRIGHRLAHKNEAPFPERIPLWLIASLCPPGGIVLDPFGGSGTTGAVAKGLGRDYFVIDIRESQCQIARQRIDETKAGSMLGSVRSIASTQSEGLF